MQEAHPCWTEGKKKPWARKEEGWASGSFLCVAAIRAQLGQNIAMQSIDSFQMSVLEL